MEPNYIEKSYTCSWSITQPITLSIREQPNAETEIILYRGYYKIEYMIEPCRSNSGMGLSLAKLESKEHYYLLRWFSDEEEIREKNKFGTIFQFIDIPSILRIEDNWDNFFPKQYTGTLVVKIFKLNNRNN